MEDLYGKLYVKYIKKKAEYRIHVFNGKIIDIQQKRKRHEAIEINFQIRSHNNGWVLGLDFGAVDIIWNEKQQQGYVLEVNTAPGLEGETIINYANAIEELINDYYIK